MDEDPEETTTNISAFDVLSCIHSNNDLDENPLTELNRQEHRSDNSYQMFDYSPPATDSSNSPENMRQLPPLTINMNPQYSYELESAPPSFIHQTPPNSGYVDPNVCTPQSMSFDQTPSGHMALQQQMMVTTPVSNRSFEASRGPPGPSRRLYQPQQREHHHPYHLPRSINMPGTSTDDFAQFFPDLKTTMKQEMEERPPSIVQLPNSDSGSVFDRNEERRLTFYYDTDAPCAPIYDEQRNEIPPLEVWVDDIKKVEWGHLENAHIVYKKNLFQFTTKVLSNFTPKYVLSSKNMIVPIKEFRLDFHGIKKESPSTIIKMDQSNASRTSKSKPDFPRFQVTAGNTVALNVTRLHFSQATEENKKPPNPHQKYFIFVINVMAVTENEEVIVRKGRSEPLIVRAGNPDSFNKGKTTMMSSKQDMDETWKENGENIVFTMKQVAIGTEIPEGMAALTVAGDVIQTGRTAGFSDANLKENQKTINTKDALENLMMLEPKTFDFKEEVAKQLGLNERSRAGFIAQEVQKILPDAVKRYGEFLTLDERRIFVEGIAATIELARAAEKMQDDINANAELIEKLMQRAEKRRTASIGSGLHKDDTLSLVSRSSSRRHLGIFCDSKVTMWTVLTAVICLMTVLAVFLGAMVFLYYVDLSHRYGGPDGNGIFPPIKAPHPPGALVDPASLQQNLTALSPVCNGNCHHSYCCSDLPERNISRITMTNMNRKPSKINPELSIFLPQLNETIDSRYCVGSCFQKERKYHLYVPISPFLPANPLLVQFRVPLGRMVNSCGYLSPFPFRTCDNNRIDIRKEKSLRQIDDVTFEIPVGRFLHSAFRFEVGFTRRSCSLLSFSDEKISNADVDEFTLVFYRRCS